MSSITTSGYYNDYSCSWTWSISGMLRLVDSCWTVCLYPVNHSNYNVLHYFGVKYIICINLCCGSTLTTVSVISVKLIAHRHYRRQKKPCHSRYQLYNSRDFTDLTAMVSILFLLQPAPDSSLRAPSPHIL